MLTRRRHVPVSATQALTPVDSLPLCCGSSHRAETEGVVSAVLSGAESTDPAYGKPYRRVACTNLCRPRCECNCGCARHTALGEMPGRSDLAVYCKLTRSALRTSLITSTLCHMSFLRRFLRSIYRPVCSQAKIHFSSC